MSKVLCPFHQDSTPSLHLYPDGFKCFVCGKHGPLESLDKEVVEDSRRNMLRNSGWGKKEDLKKSLERISKLPTKDIRGFQLPYDASGYYVVYPCEEYYTKRLWKPEKPSDKYRGPKGHKKPLWSPKNPAPVDVLFVVEGQLNAMTVSRIFGCAVVSPGGANDLNREEFVKTYLQYEHVCVIVDKDAAGVVSGIALRDTLLQHKKDVVLYPMERDLNAIYVENGEEAVKDEIRKALGQLRR